MPFPWKKLKNSRISRLVNLSHKRRDAEIKPPEMEITTASSKRKSRKAKIESKMRKIVPKKLRSAKKDHDFGIACDEGEEDHDFGIACDEGEEAMIDVSGSVSPSASENGGGEGEGEDEGGSVCSDHGVIEESDGNGCSEIAEPVAAWRSNMALCLVALAGLVGGRPFALVLTLFCLLVLKLGQGVPMMVRNKV